MNDTLLLISEPERVEDALRYSRTLSESYVFVALDLEVEQKLDARGVGYIGGKTLRTQNRERHVEAERWTSALLSGARAFPYREVPVDKILFFSLQNYLLVFLYWADVLGNLLAQRTPERIVVFDSGNQVFKTSGYLAGREIHALADCARAIAKERAVPLEVVKAPVGAQHLTPVLFSAKRALFSAGLWLLNRLLGMRGRGVPRIVVSEYWHNLAPLAPLLAGAELILFDRTQLFAAGWKEIWRLRMRFFHFDNFSTAQSEGHRETTRSLKERWVSAPPPRDFSFRGNKYDAHLQEVLAELEEGALSSALRDIDHAYSMLRTLRPDLVLLRTSTSTQLHFGILAYVARALTIPSLEFEHGLEFYGEGSLDTRKAAEYIGVYGVPIQEALAAAGYAKEKLPVVGSPRFDHYRMRAKDADGPILCTAPDFLYGVWFDSYDIDEYLRGVGQALPQEASMIIKLRSWRREKFMRTLIERHFAGKRYRITRDTPVKALLEDALFSIMPYSTTGLESMMAGVPLVLFAASPNEDACMRWHFAPYVQKEAVAVCASGEALAEAVRALWESGERRAAMRKNAAAYLGTHFAFDGKSSPRAVRLMRALSGKESLQ